MRRKKKSTNIWSKLSRYKLAIISLTFLLTALLWSSFWGSPPFPAPSGPKKAFSDAAAFSQIDTNPGYGGVSWADFNNDGLLDLLFPSKESTKLYRNNGNETFTDITKLAGLSEIKGIMSGVFGDYNNDGCPDLYLSRSGSIIGFETLEYVGQTDLLFKNNCDGTFSDASKEAGIGDDGHSQGASWVDFNNDGHLDIYVVNKGRFQNYDNWALEPNLLYQNNGNGTFSEVSQNAGISGFAKCSNFDTITGKPNSGYTARPTRGPWKFSFQPIWFDYNNDRLQDLFIATDSGISPLYLNLGDGKFSDKTESAGLCRLGTGMGVTVGDYNNDGFMDLYVTNIDSSFLWKNKGNGTFSEVAKGSALENARSLGWGTGFLDYDNDGLLDLHVVNGIFLQRDTRFRYTKRQDRLYKNLDGNKFEEVGEKEGIYGNDAKISSAYGDYNNDGFVDIAVISDGPGITGVKLPSRLYKNLPNGHNWVTIKLQGVRSNRDGVGARIILRSSGKSYYREITSGSSFLSQNSLWQTFGLGKNNSIDEVEIHWPSGTVQVIKRVTGNQVIMVLENSK